MDRQTTGTNETTENAGSIDSWEKAFAALDKEIEKNIEGSAIANGSSDNGQDSNAETNGGIDTVSNNDESFDSSQSQDDAGGLDTSSGSDSQESGNAFVGHIGVTEESIKEYESKLNDSIRDRAINDVAQEFIKRGIRNTDGVLGATLDDPDICKRDDDGVPRFYNPETGREFTGDNPRRQAQEWVDDYNKELARVFNNTCEQYESHLKEESSPSLAVMRFAPKYEKLDDIRRGMFDNVIEDYEIKDDSGEIIGYSCDLDKALSLVDRQIEMIQNYAKQRQSSQQAEQKAGSPALDMKTSSGAVQTGNSNPPSSLAEAMERLQDQQLEKLNEKLKRS